MRGTERTRQQGIVDAFDKLMHAFGVWNVTVLVERFLQKEEKFFVQYRYLDALNADAAVVQVTLPLSSWREGIEYQNGVVGSCVAEQGCGWAFRS